ncbi:MAG TPA: metal-binding protein [Pyrodictium delaneyi]|uniref:Metal-binding protein n=1 Tax=Pyrodictium delaneyi TaxID=1273541 RepID=A0A833EAN2_9CREN|nr:metal-binding protein [Pyrodictium delaneyi]
MTMTSRLSELRRRIRERGEEGKGAEAAAAREMRAVRVSASPVELWIVLGRESDYVVIPGTYCSCPHFTIRVVGQEIEEPCYHLVAVEIARRSGRYHDLSAALDSEKLVDILLETIFEGRTRTLRRILYQYCSVSEP